MQSDGGLLPGLASELRRVTRTSNGARGSRDGPRVVSGGASWQWSSTPEQMLLVIIHGWERGMYARWGTRGALELTLKTLFVPSCKTKDALRYWVSSKQRTREWKGGGQRRRLERHRHPLNSEERGGNVTVRVSDTLGTGQDRNTER